ncbi:hypothetical protein Scep_021194 [Stephania cephalantha]|uniref:PB1 domain-containing protein n=1 Tax=Stephania cephalantha TaxID=152367 RepID=A0AAP0F2Z7_9MAGN
MVRSKTDNQSSNAKALKFLCSYGGKILPRSTDGQLRYVGGEIRVLAVHRSVTFSELMVKLGEMCGSSVSLRCQLPKEDLDALVSITSDEDLASLIDDYDRASKAMSVSLKIRAFLSSPKPTKKVISPPPTTAPIRSRNPNFSVVDRCAHQISKPILHHDHCHHQLIQVPVMSCCSGSYGCSSRPCYYSSDCLPLHRIHGGHVYLVQNANNWHQL